MKRITGLAFLFIALIFWQGCELEDPSQPSLNIQQNQLILSKMVAIGNSLTAGFQSAGMVEDFQLNSFPYRIAQQMGAGASFQQPLIAAPGIGSTAGKTPLKFVNGALVADDLTVSPLTLLKNARLPRPYDNLGVPGATLNDAISATSAQTSQSGSNSFFDIVLRNPNFGNTTQVQQAIMLNPTLILLWLGNNDVLGAATAGGALERITPQSDFTAQMTTLLTELRQKTRAAIVMANIPYVTDIPFINTLDLIFRPVPALGISTPVPVVFDATFQPVDFGGGLYLPLLTEEQGVTHLTIPALSAYQAGLGVPNAAALMAMGFADTTAAALEQGMIAAGLTPTGQPIPGTMSLTADESATIRAAVDGYNATIAALAQQFQVPVVDANTMLNQLNSNGLDGYSGRFVLLDPANTAFSLDGVHPNNGGYAIIANAFIEVINTAFQLNIPKLNTADYKGQYVSQAQKMSWGITSEIADQVRAIF
ncbi:MAG TPA: hypothetical protein ENJ29_01750 [Bacteroidetes bacterium]|nr:hypothetical protein [Bacteroidota bacterium]